MSVDALIERIPDGHTPGPWWAWQVGRQDDGEYFICTGVEGDSGGSIFEGGGVMGSDAENAANATLFALAPDLAAALRDTPALIAHLEAQGYAVVPGGTEWSAVFDAMQAKLLEAREAERAALKAVGPLREACLAMESFFAADEAADQARFDETHADHARAAELAAIAKGRWQCIPDLIDAALNPEPKR